MSNKADKKDNNRISIVIDDIDSGGDASSASNLKIETNHGLYDKEKSKSAIVVQEVKVASYHQSFVSSEFINNSFGNSGISVSIVVDQASDSHDIDAVIQASPSLQPTPTSLSLKERLRRSRSHSSAASIGRRPSESGIDLNGTESSLKTTSQDSRRGSIVGLSIFGLKNLSVDSPSQYQSINTLNTESSIQSQPLGSQMLFSGRSKKNQMAQRTSLTAEELKKIMNQKPKKNNTKAFNIQKVGKSILADVEIFGLGLILDNVILSLYFGMYCIERNIHPLWFFINDIRKFKQDYQKQKQNERVFAARRLFDLYLQKDSKMYISLCLPVQSFNDTQLLELLISQAQSKLTELDSGLFNALKLLVIKYFEIIYGLIKRPTSSINSLNNETYNETFLTSAQFQCLKTDFADSPRVTNNHATRAIQRVLDFPLNILSNIQMQLFEIFDLTGIEWKSFAKAQMLLNDQSQKKVPRTSLSITQQIQQNIKGSFNSLVSSADDRNMQIAADKSLNRNEGSIDQHAFVKSSLTNNQKFCEFCFKEFDKNDQQLIQFTCELCQYAAHKTCKNQINVCCFAVSATSQLIDGKSQSTVERVKILAERYHSLIKEAEISQDLKKGLSKIAAASELSQRTLDSKRVSNFSQKDSEKIDRKIKFLNSEKQKVLGNLAVLLQKLSKQQLSDMNDESGVAKDLGILLQDMPNSIGIKIQIAGDTIQGQSQASKSIVINHQTTVQQAIAEFFKRIGIQNEAFPFTLTFENENGEEFTLESTDRPLIVQYLLPNCLFYVKESINQSSVIEQEGVTLDKSKVSSKRKAIIQELIDTDAGYLENLKIVVQAIQKPLADSQQYPKLIINGIFGNIESLIPIHEKLLVSLKTRMDQSFTYETSVMQSMLEIVKEKEFENQYMKYCSNQHGAQRTLSKLLKDSQDFNKQLKNLEKQSKSKLSLADILIQPMHRITRYPILLKRLLQCTPNDHPDYDYNAKCIEIIEKVAQNVDNVVHQKESEYKIQSITQHLDWNDQCESFDLKSEGRKLVNEKPLFLHKKNNQVALLSLVFSDLVMFVQVQKKKDQETYILNKPPLKFSDILALDFQADDSSGKDVKTKFQLFDKSNNGSIILTTLSLSDKNAWLKELWQLTLSQLHDKIETLQSQKFNFGESLSKLFSDIKEQDILLSLLKDHVKPTQQQRKVTGSTSYNPTSSLSLGRKQSKTSLDDNQSVMSGPSGKIQSPASTLNSQGALPNDITSTISKDSSDTKSIDSYNSIGYVAQSLGGSVNFKQGGISSQQLFANEAKKPRDGKAVAQSDSNSSKTNTKTTMKALKQVDSD